MFSLRASSRAQRNLPAFRAPADLGRSLSSTLAPCISSRRDTYGAALRLCLRAYHRAPSRIPSSNTPATTIPAIVPTDTDRLDVPSSEFAFASAGTVDGFAPCASARLVNARLGCMIYDIHLTVTETSVIAVVVVKVVVIRDEAEATGAGRHSDGSDWFFSLNFCLVSELVLVSL